MKPNIEFLYEQLRKETDGASESMTHDDAIEIIRVWRDAYYAQKYPQPEQEPEALKPFETVWRWTALKDGKEIYQYSDKGAPSMFSKSAVQLPTQPKPRHEPVAYLTRNEDGDPAMLFFDRAEAETYCAEEEDPEPLYLRAAIEQELSNKKNIMPLTDDHGKALHDQRRVIDQRGKWRLIYDQHQIGDTVHHEFRIQKLTHDIVLYPGITLDEAKKRFAEKVEADNE